MNHHLITAGITIAIGFVTWTFYKYFKSNKSDNFELITSKLKTLILESNNKEKIAVYRLYCLTFFTYLNELDKFIEDLDGIVAIDIIFSAHLEIFQKYLNEFDQLKEKFFMQLIENHLLSTNITNLINIITKDLKEIIKKLNKDIDSFKIDGDMISILKWKNDINLHKNKIKHGSI